MAPQPNTLTTTSATKKKIGRQRAGQKRGRGFRSGAATGGNLPAPADTNGVVMHGADFDVVGFSRGLQALCASYGIPWTPGIAKTVR